MRQTEPQRKVQYQERRPLGRTEDPRCQEGQPSQDLQVSDGVERQSWSLNRETEKAFDKLVILYELFEQVNGHLANVDKKFDKDVEEMEEARMHNKSWR